MKEITKSEIDSIIESHNKVGVHASMMLKEAIGTGGKLIKAKAKLQHGQWLPWVKENLPISERLVQDYMRFYENREKLKNANVADLTEARKLLTPPISPKERAKAILDAKNEGVSRSDMAEILDVDEEELQDFFDKRSGKANTDKEDEQPAETGPDNEVIELNADVFPERDRASNRKPVFNRTNENIDWAKWSWNPVTGCKNDCDYCYAKDLAGRFNGGDFEPDYHPDRLGAPENTRPINIEGGNTVFVCSMADLFGTWIPNDWIWPVIEQAERNPQWTFIFLTKNPRRYASIQFPDNAWIGATVDTQSRVKQTEDAMARAQATVKFVSCEPLFEPVVFNTLEHIDWVIIGARSATSTGPELQPKLDWVLSLLRQTKAAGIPAYCKPNLNPSWPKGYPSIVSGSVNRSRIA